MRRALVCLALLLAAGCAPPRADVDPRTIVVAVHAAPASLDPRIGTDEVSQRVHQLVFSPLMDVDADLRVVPALAARLDNPDPLTYIAHLRAGVIFHDGTPLTSRDVVYTFSSFLDPSFVSARSGAYGMLASVRALDETRVEFKLHTPFAAFPINLVMPIVPDGSGDSLRSFPIGTGPYRFVRYVDDEEVALSTFEGYWDGLPQNTGVVLKIVPDETMRALELRKGTVDLMLTAVSPDVAHQLARDGITVAHSPGVDYAYIGFNMRDPLLADWRVRHAIGYAVNRRAIVDHLRRGLGRPAAGIVPPISWAFEPDVHQFTHDPDRARRLLDEAGYADPDGDGPRPRFQLSLKTSSDEFFRLQAAVIQQDLRQVGIEVDIRSYEFATFYADVLKGSFQMVTMQWVGVTDPDMLRRVFHSQQTPPVGFNRGYYRNPEVDRLLDRAMTAPTQEEQRRHYAAVQRLVAEDAPYISLWHKTNIAVIRPGVTGVRLRPQLDFQLLKDVRKDRATTR